MMKFVAAREIMVDSQIRPNDVPDQALIGAFLRTPREVFVSGNAKSIAYSEKEIETSPGRSLWTPRDTAMLMHFASIEPSDIVLIVGAGAGYEAALLSQIAETVIALEEDTKLVEAMSNRFAALGLDRAVAVQGAIKEGLADQAPFDVIYICGMVQTIPDSWKAQLAEGGRLALVRQVDADLGQGEVHVRSGENVAGRAVFEACPPKWDAFDRTESFVF